MRGEGKSEGRCIMSDVSWGTKETVTVINCKGQRRTLSFRICSLCGAKIAVDGPDEGARYMAQHVEDHATGQVEKDEAAIWKRMKEINALQPLQRLKPGEKPH